MHHGKPLARSIASVPLALVLSLMIDSATAAAPVFPAGAEAAQAAATTRLYVATDGKDANPGTWSRPLRTLQRAADLVMPGTTVVIRGGTYVGFTLRRSGVAGAP